MFYEKPRPSAGLILAGILGLVAACLVSWLVSWIGLAMNEPPAVGVAFILAAVGGICLVVGLLRFFSAFDAVALHRWETLLAAKNEETKKLADERKYRVEDDTNR